VTSRGNERRAIYRDDGDRRCFCQLLGQTAGGFGWQIHAYVLMDNHYHLLVETPEPNLGRGMQWLNVSYSVWFNRRHQRSGHLFQGRYKSILVDPTGWGLELSRYVHLNPVRVGRHGMGKTERQRLRMGVAEKPDAARVKRCVAELRRYRWSSYRAYFGLAKAPEWLRREAILRLGERRMRKDARQRYCRYVESAVRQGLEESPWEKLTAQAVLGGAEFVRKIGKALGSGHREHGGWRQLKGRPNLGDVIAAVEEVKKERWEEFRDRYGDWGRDLVLYLGKRGLGIKLAELGNAAGGMDYMAVSASVRRLEGRTQRDSALLTALKRCCKELGLNEMSNV
jgi:putative transposase